MRYATKQDYVRIQGGMPQITHQNGLWHIEHDYLLDSPVVRTHISPDQRGTVMIIVDGTPVEFEVSKLWMFEGQPCELTSIGNGGSSYERAKKMGRP